MAKLKPESEETPEDETAESPEVQAKEDKEGTEEHSEGQVRVPEEFQKEASVLVNKCATLACLSFLSDLCYERRSALEKSQKKNKLSTDDFKSDEMPVD